MRLWSAQPGLLQKALIFWSPMLFLFGPLHAFLGCLKVSVQLQRHANPVSYQRKEGDIMLPGHCTSGGPVWPSTGQGQAPAHFLLQNPALQGLLPHSKAQTHHLVPPYGTLPAPSHESALSVLLQSSLVANRVMDAEDPASNSALCSYVSNVIRAKARSSHFSWWRISSLLLGWGY